MSSPRGADGRGRGRNPETPGRASGPSRDHRAQNPRERFCQAVRGSPEQWDVGRGPGRGQQGHPLSLAGWPWAGPRPLVRGVTPHRWRASLRGRPRMRWRWAPPCTSSLSAGSFRASRTARDTPGLERRRRVPLACVRRTQTHFCAPSGRPAVAPGWVPHPHVASRATCCSGVCPKDKRAGGSWDPLTYRT